MKLEESLCTMVAELRYEDLPGRTVTSTKRLLFDTVGTMFAGSSQEGSAQIAHWARSSRGSGESTIGNFGGTGRSTDVAVANGYMAHALDYDETHDRSELHTGVAIIPAVLAAAEASGICDGEKLIESIVCGVEVHTRLGIGVLDSPFEYGWVYTSVLGAIGAAAATAKLLGGDEDVIWNAMGIAYSESSGNCQTSTDGALAKRLQPGLAAGAGIRAAELALAGISGAKEFVNGKYGLASLYFRDRFDSSNVTNGLGSEWQVEQLSFKPYPCCRVIHGAIDLVLEAVKVGTLRPESLRSMRVGTSAGGQKDLGEPPDEKRRPSSFVDCQFSLPWIVALTIVNGRGLKAQDMGPFNTADPEVVRTVDKITTFADPRIGIRDGASKISVAFDTLDGQSHESMTSSFYGSPDSPMSDEALAEKFRDCLAMAHSPLPTDVANRLHKRVMELESLNHTTEIAELLAPVSSGQTCAEQLADARDLNSLAQARSQS